MESRRRYYGAEHTDLGAGSDSCFECASAAHLAVKLFQEPEQGQERDRREVVGVELGPQAQAKQRSQCVFQPPLHRQQAWESRSVTNEWESRLITTE